MSPMSSNKSMRALVCAAVAASAPLILAPTEASAGVIGGDVILGVSGYAQPSLNSPYLIMHGDSRTANGGGATWSGGTTISFGQTLNSFGYSGWIAPISGNALVTNYGANYGVGAQSSAGIAGRLATTTADCNDFGSASNACFTGSAGTASAWSSGTQSFTFTYSSGAAVSTCSGSTCPYVQISN